MSRLLKSNKLWIPPPSEEPGIVARRKAIESLIAPFIDKYEFRCKRGGILLPAQAQFWDDLYQTLDGVFGQTIVITEDEVYSVGSQKEEER